jgi:hypothetical protein
MATSEEKQELVEAIKGPRFYHIQLNGYGGESAYMSISKEAHDFWQPVCEKHGDSDLVSYMVNDEPDECEFENIDSVLTEADFLTGYGKDDYKSNWHEAPTEFEHSYGVEWGSAYIVVDEVNSMEYDARHIADVIEGENLSDLVHKLEEESNYELELTNMDCADDVDYEYIAQMYSSEKGNFFDGVIETTGEFDAKKLKVHTTEYLNGEDTVTSIEYDGVEVDNNGGDTNGKGYSASVWKN